MIGKKYDAGKIRAGLVLGDFARALASVSAVGTFGAKKYGDSDWLHVPDGLRRYEDAMLRHWLSVKRGEQLDEESALPHLAHLAWNALAILELTLRREDDALGLRDVFGSGPTEGRSGELRAASLDEGHSRGVD